LVYPNPTQGEIKIESKHQIGLVSIYNLLGKKVMETQLTNNVLKITKLPNGIYFIKVKTEKGISTQKIVKGNF